MVEWWREKNWEFCAFCGFCGYFSYFLLEGGGAPAGNLSCRSLLAKRDPWFGATEHKRRTILIYKSLCSLCPLW